MDLDANVVDSGKKPSSEWELHSVFYKNKPDIGAVVHTHPKYSTIFATLHLPVKPVHYAIAAGGESRLRDSPFYEMVL